MGEMATTLAKIKPGDSLAAQGKTWAAMSESELKREAAKAANAKDLERLQSLAEAYLYLHGKKGGQLSEGTRSQYRTALRDLLKAWSHENLLRPSQHAGLMYVRGLEDKLRPSTVQTKVAAARNLYKALRWSKATEANPFENASPVADPTPAWEKRGHYEKNEIEALCSYADSLETVIVLLGAHAGLRVSEMVGLRWDDIGQGKIKVLGKGKKVRSPAISQRLELALDDLAKNTKRAGYVLPFGRMSVYNRVRNLAEKAGVEFESRGVHGLRHSAGTRLYRETKDLAITADHLGHENVNTTRGYAKRDPERIREQIREW